MQEPEHEGAAAERDEYGLPRPPIAKTLGEPVIVLEHVQKRTYHRAPPSATALTQQRRLHHCWAQGSGSRIGGHLFGA